jgi:diguanylate cyclase (GGDEF)-like protein/PAS domain S-box-containing protein
MKNKYIGLRLGTAFAVLIVILVGIGQLGLRRTQEINKALSDIAGRQTAKLQLAQRALELSNRNSRITMELFLVPNRALIEPLLAARLENTRNISEVMAEIEGRCESVQENQRLSAVKEARTLYIDSYMRALHLLVDKKQHNAASAVMVNEALPALLRYYSAWNEFVEFQKDQVDMASKQAHAEYIKAHRLASWLIVLAVAVALGIAVFTTRQAQKSYRQQIVAREGAEFGLQRSEDSMRRAMEGAKIGCWDWDVLKDEQVWSDTCKSLMGLEPERIANFQGFMNSVHPDDRKMLEDRINAAVQEKKDFSVEFRVVWPDGSTHWQSAKGQAFYDETGRTTRMSGIAMDIDERKRAEERLHLQAAALEAAANAIVITDSHGTILWVNHAFTTITGYGKEEVLGKNTRLLKSEEQSESDYVNLWSTISSGKVWKGEIVNRRKDGTTYTQEMTITPVTPDVGNPANRYFVAIKQDITERKQAEEALLFKTALLEAQAETTIDGILVVSESDHILLANKQFGLHFGIPNEVLSTRDDVIVRKYVADQVEDSEAFVARVKHLNGHREEKSRDELRLKNGKTFDRYSAPLVDSNRRYRGRIWSFGDITSRKVAEERVRYLAYYDALTELPNRTLLQDRLAKALASARRRKDKVAFLFLDLDRFKDINDSLGHAVGDLLLQEVAVRLKTWAREQDTVSRVGGDEFLIVLTGVREVGDAAVAAERLMDAMTAEFVVQGHSLGVSCSLGISIFPEHGADGETLIKNADAAMYSAKDIGRNNFQFFTADMNAQAVERLALENGLRLALEKKELFLVYQPQMNITNGRITGLEALLRWQHPELGLVPPDRFIRIAENSGLIVPIGEWVLRTACSQARKWQDEGIPAVSLAVNVSAVQFRQEGFCQLIRKVLGETGLAPQHLELELTESLLLANADVTFSVLQELTDLGVTLAIDDFGIGYSSFTYLRQFRVSKLKIDRSFITNVAANPDDAAITAAIISMAKSLHLKVIAEGVEDEAQMSFLRAHQCDEIQGYYFSKPLAVDKVADKLRGHDLEHAQAQASGGQS